jgi:glucose-6-phosphate 1-epimerase
MSTATHLADLGVSALADAPAVTLRSPDGARATILHHGAHLVSWQPAGGEEQIYLSPLTDCAPGKAVRGGVPVIFPQFSDQGPGRRHGFARTHAWTLEETGVRGEHAFAVFSLNDNEATRAEWPHAFSLELTVSISKQRIDIELAVNNPGETSFDFTAALHTYLRCDNVLKAQVEGLQDCTYEDKLQGTTRQQWSDVLGIAQATDRIYWAAPQPLMLRGLGQKVRTGWDGFEDAVIWNPGPEACARMADMPPEGWRDMICIEAARIANPVMLAPGGEWVGMQTMLKVG